jgi:hypothetical protein
MMEHYTIYLEKLNSIGGLTCGAIITGINFWIFPETTLAFAAIAVLVMVIMDVITKYYYLSNRNGGYKKARKCGAINSQQFWDGTKVKLITYAVVMIIAGLSYRVTALEIAGTVFSSVAYGAMFWREAQSIGENLHVDWLTAFAKRKENEVLGKTDEEGIEKESGGNI